MNELEGPARNQSRVNLPGPTSFDAFLEETSEGLVSRILLSHEIAGAKRKVFKKHVEAHLREMQLAYDTRFRTADVRACELLNSETRKSVNSIFADYSQGLQEAVEQYLDSRDRLMAQEDKLPDSVFEQMMTEIIESFQKQRENLKTLKDEFLKRLQEQ